MSLNEEMELLRRVPLFADVPPARLKLLAFTSDRVSFAPGQELFKQGDSGDAAYVLLSGTADVLIGSPSGEIRVGEVGANEIIGEIAILCDVGRTATIKATCPLTALRIKKDHFLKLLTEFPEMAIEIMRVLAKRLNHTNMDLTAARSEIARFKAKSG